MISLLDAGVISVIALALAVRWLEPRFAFFPLTGETATPRDYGVDYEHWWIDTNDGERLSAWRLPHRLPRARIVYFHGNGGNLSMWTPVLAGIVAHGYAVLAFDYRGYGVSTGRPTESGLLRDVDAVIDRVSRERDQARPLVYWGRSLGTAMAAYAATVRKPDGLILESGFSDARSLVRSSPVLALLSLFSTYRFPTAGYLQRVAAPVLVIHGNRDRVIPFERGRELYDRLSGPKSFLLVAGGDHNDLEPADAYSYWESIGRFVDALPR
jgi:fermentation-respiration switch protein FrsA (DUF1100 family)